MLECPCCKVEIEGNKSVCPLCGGVLSGTPTDYEPYPIIKPPKYPNNLLIKMITAACLLGSVICLIVNYIFPTEIAWSLFAVFSIFCGYVTCVSIIKNRSNILKNIVWQVVIISGLAVIWDLITVWKGWSIDYVFPCMCIAAMISMIVLSNAMHLDPSDYIVYLILDVVFGIVPIVFFFTGILNSTIPSVISIGLSFVSMIILLMFEGKNLKSQISRKLHM